MKTTKLTIRHIEVEGSPETINSIVKSLGDLIPVENGKPNKDPGPKMVKTKKGWPAQMNQVLAKLESDANPRPQ